MTHRRPSPLFLVLTTLSVLSACELIADFDQSKLDENRTVGPTPLPTTDGAVAVVPDGSTQLDGALLRDDAATRSDASTDAGAPDGNAPITPVDTMDATVDAQVVDAATVEDSAVTDPDAGPDAAIPSDTEDSGEPEDAGFDLFADV